jgi:uncharacterized protein DUF2510
MAGTGEERGATAERVARWRAPLEMTALLLLAALLVSVVGGIVDGVFSEDTSAWEKLSFLGFNVVSPWHVAVLLIAVGLVVGPRVPFDPDARGASVARLALLDAMILGAVIALCALLAIIGTIGRNTDFGPTVPQKIGEIMQFLGGGTVAAVATLLAMRAQSLVPAPVRPATAPPPPAPAPGASAPTATAPTATAPTAATPTATAPTAPAAAGPGSAGWAADPYGRHQWRYWDGTRWTDQVADGSTQRTDPVG